MAETEDVDAAAPAALEAPTDGEGVPLDTLLEPPYSAETLEKMTLFFQKRKKDVETFTYTPEGDLQIKAGARVPEGIIQLKRFLQLEPAERMALEEHRLGQLAQLEEEYEAAQETLREAWTNYAVSGGVRAVIAANQKVAELDTRRNAVRSASQSIVHDKNPVTRDILLDQPYETRKLFQAKDPFEEKLFRLVIHDFKPEQGYGKYVADELVPGAEAALAADAAEGGPDETAFRQTLTDGRKARIFFDTTSSINGFLSPMWAVDFIMDETRYVFALQAYEAERARELGKEDLRKAILGTRSPRTVRMATQGKKGEKAVHPADARGLWMKILTAIYQQHPELKEKLLATGTDSLVYADDREGPSGIGSTAALDPTKWKGENLVGVCLESIRTRLREETLEEAPAEVAKGGAITEEEQKKAKVGAIINARRFGGGR